MKMNFIQKTVIATLGAVVLATSLSSPAASMPMAVASNAVFDTDTPQVVKVGGKHRRNRHRHNRHYNNHFYGHDNYRPYYNSGCHWRKKRYWDGHGYYYRRIRVCG